MDAPESDAASAPAHHSHATLNEERRSPLRWDFMLPALKQTRALQDLTLGGSLILAKEMLLWILRGVPTLHVLRLRNAYVESCEPLQHAPGLRTLECHCCWSLSGLALPFRTELPRLPRLTALNIHDFDEQQLTPEQAAPLNRALLALMPRLHSTRYEQNLL